MEKQVQRITTKALFYRDGKVLFAKDHKGKWELPGGKIDFGETPDVALKRELYEELGFKNVVIGKIINVWTFIVNNIEEIDYQFILVVYECSSKETEIKQSSEHVEYGWVPLDEIDQLEMRDGYKEAVRAYRELKNI